jgi:gliding motility-associated-like protein
MLFRSFTIKAYESPVANFAYSPINPTEGLETVTFTNTSTGSANSGWNWYFINNNGYISNQPNTSYLFENAGNYPIALVVKNKFGCSDTIIQVINVAEDHSLYVPNAFTPNYDGKHDVFRGVGIMTGATNFKFQIWNRWGERVFYTDDIDQGWNGNHLNTGSASPEGVYITLISYKDPRGVPVEIKGFVTLLR